MDKLIAIVAIFLIFIGIILILHIGEWIRARKLATQVSMGCLGITHPTWRDTVHGWLNLKSVCRILFVIGLGFVIGMAGLIWNAGGF